MRPIHHLYFALFLLMNPVAQGAESRLACTLLAKADLKLLLGSDHDAPVNFGKESCRVESKTPGRNIFLSITGQTAAETANWLTMIRKLNLEQRKDEVDVIAEPSLSGNAFSVLEKGKSPREVEIYAAKGGQGLVLNATFATGNPLGTADIGRLRQLAASLLAHLP